MDFKVEEQGSEGAVIHVSGRLDLVSAGALKDRVAATVHGGRSDVVIDLAEVPFIDSSGLGALIGGLRAARLAGGDLRIARPAEQARAILRLTTLDRILTPFETVEAAFARP